MTRRLYTFCRYFVAAVVFLYGFAKLTGAQFTVLDSELDKPLRDISGFWLTWYYYGYSVVYGNFIALVQIGAGTLLMFRRTTLLGAAVLFGVLSNIALINVFYGVGLGALVVALLLVACLAFVLWQHRSELAATFWPQRNAVYSGAPARRTPAALRYAVRAGLLVLAGVWSYWVANYNNRVPTPLDGRWAVESVRGLDDAPSTVYFERNRAFMVILRYGDRWEQRHFEVQAEGRRVSIWSEWLQKGDRVFVGRYDVNGNRLVLVGDWEGSSAELVLRRMPAT